MSRLLNNGEPYALKGARTVRGGGNGYPNWQRKESRTLPYNLGADPDFQQLDNNIAVAKFSLATTETFKDKNGQIHTNTDWHTVVLWRSLAELAHKHLQKGSLVYVEGKLKTRSYDDREGIKRYVTEVVAEQLIMLDKKTGGDSND